MDKARRAHARFPSDMAVEVFTGPVGGVRIGEGALLDLSLSGCLLRFSGLLRLGSVYRLRCQWTEGILDLPARLVRDAGQAPKHPKSRHYGLAFNLTYNQEKSLRRLVDLVRRSPKPEEDRFMRGYWG